MSSSGTCEPTDHRFYVAEVLAVETEGKVYVLIVCTACGTFLSHELQVAPARTGIRLLMEERRQNPAQ